MEGMVSRAVVLLLWCFVACAGGLFVFVAFRDSKTAEDLQDAFGILLAWIALNAVCFFWFRSHLRALKKSKDLDTLITPPAAKKGR